MRKRSWTQEQLKSAINNSKSVRSVLIKLSLKPTGGNYKQIIKYASVYGFDMSHFTGKLWSKGLKLQIQPRIPLQRILTVNSTFQSYKLKRRLINEGLKTEKCECCGWHEKSSDGRIPLELDHINGISTDNRIENLQILCPNCHSLRPNHRGRNMSKFRLK